MSYPIPAAAFRYFRKSGTLSIGGGWAKVWSIYGLALVLTTIANGIIKLLVLGRGHTAGFYLAAVSGSLLVAALWAVVLAVWWERPWQAPLFVCLAATISGLLFYRAELMAGHLTSAAIIVVVVATTVWVLANLGCALRQRLRAMD